MIESIRESVVYMAHTHDGARVAMHCLWHGTAKVSTQTHTESRLCLLWAQVTVSEMNVKEKVYPKPRRAPPECKKLLDLTACCLFGSSLSFPC